MELWHEVETTVMIITHSIAEAVYLGDHVWVMSPGPGRIAQRFQDIIPKTRDADPIAVQSTRRVQGGGRGSGARLPRRRGDRSEGRGLKHGRRAAVLLGLREGRVLEAGALAHARRHAAHADAARGLRPRRLLQPRLLAARPGHDRGDRGRALVERALPEADRRRAHRGARREAPRRRCSGRTSGCSPPRSPATVRS